MFSISQFSLHKSFLIAFIAVLSSYLLLIVIVLFNFKGFALASNRQGRWSDMLLNVMPDLVSEPFFNFEYILSISVAEE